MVLTCYLYVQIETSCCVAIVTVVESLINKSIFIWLHCVVMFKYCKQLSGEAGCDNIIASSFGSETLENL